MKSIAKVFLLITLGLLSCTRKEEVKTFYENGKLKGEGYLLDGMKEGKAKVYYESGRLKEEGTWKNNKQEGEWLLYYDSDNKLSARVNFKDDNQ